MQGERKNEGKLRWRNFPLFLVEDMIRVGAAAEKHAGNPEGKYATFNFLNGLGVNDSLDSALRHLKEAQVGVDIDADSGCYNLAAVAWNCLVALHNIKNRPDLDDRYRLPLKSPSIVDGVIITNPATRTIYKNY